MSYKSILTVLSDPRQMPQLDAAAAVAAHEDGHLSVLSLGLDHTQVGYYFPNGMPYAFPVSYTHLTLPTKRIV